eukprot:CAMPEP_0201646954 /NCGR_PEP_ID=MMETSP0493-20130528/34886_1 /ASSEMBLY_ACC=CAM_ASM_000838 /TAXON_ID=420259 /ORGANISM="Thalassiosira gravida, Strain GMp14c1" /LENGTH=46 /DNA_ID= /DNA_START= /DNA_END= /DNA_ORIENTATION=
MTLSATVASDKPVISAAPPPELPRFKLALAKMAWPGEEDGVVLPLA